MLKKRYENIKFTNNNLKEKDYLDNLIYATNLEEKIQEYFESNNQKPIYIALTGGWGSGKTTVAKTVITSLKDKYTDNFRLFEFDAWKYEGDSFRRTFTSSILKQSGMDKDSSKYKDFYNRLYNDKSVEIESFSERIKLSKYVDTNYKSFLAWSILFCVIILYLILLYFFPVQVVLITCIIATAFGYLEGTKLIKANVSYSFDKLFSPEQFYDTINEILDEVKEEYKLILIDNIDRCNDSDFVDTISSIKGFFNDDGKKIVYLIPFDVDQFNNAFNKEYLSYSEKVFDDTVDIKEKSVKNIIEFMDKLLKDYPDYSELFTDDAIAVIANSDCKTPRQILNICNNYITEYNLFILKNKLDTSNIKSEDLSYLMKYTVLKINHKTLFNRIHIDSELIEKLEASARYRDLYDNVIKNVEFKDWLSQTSYNFMLKNYAILPTNYSYFYESQNDNSFSIDKSVEDAILTEEFNTIIEKIENDGNLLEQIISYLKKSLIFNIEKNHWKTQISHKVQLIIHLLKNEFLSIEQINSNFDFLLRNDKLFTELFYTQIISVDEFTYFISCYITKYPKKNKFIQKLFFGLVNKRFNVSAQEELLISSKIFNAFPIDDSNDELVQYFDKYIESIFNNRNFKNEPFNKIFSSKNGKFISDARLVSFLTNTTSNDISVISPLLLCGKNKLLVSDSDSLMYNYISFINRVTSALKETAKIVEITEFLLELKDHAYWKSRITSLNINITIEEECERLYNSIFNLIKITNNNSLKNILLSLKNQKNKNVVVNLLKNTQSSSSLIEFTKSFISRFNDEEFINHMDFLVDLYENGIEYEGWINQYLYANKKDLIIDFYSKLKNPDKREVFINYIIGQNLTFDQKINFISLYQTDNNRYDDLLNRHSNISELCKIAINTTTPSYFDKCILKLVDVVNSKGNIIDSEIINIEALMNSDIISSSQKQSILMSIGITKATKENLFKIYNKTFKTKRIPEECKIIESFLIEAGLVESTRKKSKTTENELVK